MASTRQPVLTVSPVQEEYRTEHPPAPQTTPKLPKRDRLNSLSRLLKNKNFKNFSERRAQNQLANPPSVVIHASSPPQDSSGKETVQDFKQFLSPNHLPFSPGLLSRSSPPACLLSPSYKQPTPIRLYTPPNIPKRFLGRGSFGKVSLISYKGKELAVKVAYDEKGDENLIQIRHPHLVEIYHVSKMLDGGTLVFMEFAGHCNLQQVLDTKSELLFRRRISFCIQIITGLRHCHRNRIVHGDVKPSNVMVSSRGICKLGDFGHSKRMDGSSPPSKAIVGTVAYAAPEVLKGCRPGPESDIYSFGVLLWQVQTREMPFDGEHPHVIIYKVVNSGSRPKFLQRTDVSRVAEDCWRTLPSQRITPDQIHSKLVGIMQSMEQ